jgi:hypothetical protein
MKRNISWKEIKDKIELLPKDKKYWGVPRGGMYIAAMLNPVDDINDADIIIDDLIDSGRTEIRYKERYPDKTFIALYDKRKGDNDWLIFPWEIEDEGKEAADYLIRIAQYLNIKMNIEK